MKRVRMFMSLTKAQACMKIGITEKTYRKFERGDIEIPDDKYVSYMRGMGAIVTAEMKVVVPSVDPPFEFNEKLKI